MRNVIFTASLLLCCLNGISASGVKIQSVEVKPGEDVKLLCSNFSSVPTQIIWSRVNSRPNIPCVVSMFKPEEDTNNCKGFPKEKFVMSSNISVVFLTIKTVNVSDSGLYFCGYYFQRKPVIHEATHLEVHATDTEQTTSSTLNYLAIGILSTVTVLLVMVIYLVVKNKRLQDAGRAESYKNPQHQRRGSDHLDYAAVTFHRKTEHNHREAEVDVIYSSPRQNEEEPQAADLMSN